MKKLKKMWLAFGPDGKPDYDSLKSKKKASKRVMAELYGGWDYWKVRGWKVKKVWIVIMK